MQDYDYDYDYTDYMRMMNVPTHYSPMMEMPHEQLESMYPRCYHIVMPEVERCCVMMFAKFGPMYMPTRQHVESMVDEIDDRIGASLDAEYPDDPVSEERQFGFGFGGRRRFRRDLISILLLRRLLRRRHPHFGFGFGGFPF